MDLQTASSQQGRAVFLVGIPWCHSKCHATIVAIYSIKNVNELIIETGDLSLFTQSHCLRGKWAEGCGKLGSLGIFLTFYCYKSFNKQGRPSLLACLKYPDDARNL